MCKDQKFVLVDTPHTIRARELRDLYHALNLPMLSVDERLQILLHVKYTTKEFDCNLTREIVELIDREGDLVSRGRPEKSLEGMLNIIPGLRKRINSLFLQFIRTPEFNPEALAHQKVPHIANGSGSKTDAAVYYCRGCTCYKPSTEFYMSTTMKHLGKCKECTNQKNVALERNGETVYSDMLRLIRAQEASRRRSSHQAIYNAMSLLQGSDMRYLIDVVWSRKSAVSASSNLDELILTRWDVDEELSPWNCILLTKAEAATHDITLSNASLEQTYSLDFRQKVAQKHIVSRSHFSQLPAIAKYMKQTYVEIDTFDGKLTIKQTDVAVQ